MKIYYCQDAQSSRLVGADEGSDWLSELFQPDLDVCRLASSDEVRRKWNPGFGDFNGQVLDLSDGQFRASVKEVPHRSRTKKAVDLASAGDVAPVPKPE